MSFGVNRFFSHRFLPVWLTLVLGLAATGWLARGLYQQAEKLDEQRFKLEAVYLAALLEGSMERYEERLARLADHCAQFKELPEKIWSFRAKGVTDLAGNLPAVVHAVYCPKITANEFQDHTARGREVWGVNYVFDPGPQPDRDLALPIWQIWTRTGFQNIPRGTDMAQETPDHPSMRRGLIHRRGGVSASAVQVPRTNGTNENGFWFSLALFKPDQTADFRGQGRNESPADFQLRQDTFHLNAAIGILAAFISTDRMVDGSYNDPMRSPRLHLRLYASREPSPETLLNRSSPAPVNPRHRQVTVQSWYGRRWALEFTSTPQFEADSPRSRSWLVLAAGSGMTLLAGALLGGALRARTQQDEMIEQIREARDALAAAQQERQKLSHNLHDNTIQALYAIQLGLNHTSQKIEAEPASARRELSAVRGELDAVIAEFRRFITAEKKDDKPADLCSVLGALVQRARRGVTTQVGLHCHPDAAHRLSGDQSVQLANIAREALSNSLRHAKPERVEIALRAEKDSVALEIHDDGAGFDPLSPGQQGVGLTSMTARARDMGAALEIQSSPGQGCRVVVRVPASPARAASPEFRNNNES